MVGRVFRSPITSRAGSRLYLYMYLSQQPYNRLDLDILRGYYQAIILLVAVSDRFCYSEVDEDVMSDGEKK